MYVITGATGKLGQHIVEQLLAKVPASRIRVLARDLGKASELFRGKGLEIRQADYSRPETLKAAFQGAEKVMLISGNEIGQRESQHRAVISAVQKSGAKTLVYTSLLHADRAGFSLALEHRPTEQAIKDSGLEYVILRNGWYFENYTENLAPALAHGALLGSAGMGRISAASRADYAAAAVEALTGSGHKNKIYELGGDESFTMAELAAEVSQQSGKKVIYQNMPETDYKAALVGFGLPEVLAGALANADSGIARGELENNSGQLRKLIGRPTTPLSQAVRRAL